MLFLSLLTHLSLFSQNLYFPYYEVEKININGNKTTKECIILNELLFQKGSVIDTSKLDNLISESRNNLLNKSLFNFVTIDYDITGKNITVNIIVEERWYVWPTFLLKFEDRNFNSWLDHKDLKRITFGAGVDKYNFRGLNEKIKFKFTVGYIQNFQFVYENLYFGKKNKHSLGINLNFQNQRQISYLTEYNKLSEIKINEGFALKKYEILLIYKYRQNLYSTHTVFLKNQDFVIHDSIFILNNNYLGGQKHIRFLHILYEFEISKKNNKSYPTKGYYLKIGLQKNGLLPLIDDVNLGYIRLTASKFFEISDNIFFANQINAKISFPKSQPYFYNDALGYDNFVRGYELYVIDGNIMLLNRNSLKYRLIENYILNFKFFPVKQFSKIHISLFLTSNFDCGYVKDFTNNYLVNNNYLTNKLLYGYGLGLDFVTYYDKVLRVEYSLNNISEKAVFIHFKTLF